jgi:hypothetical protein
VRADPARGDVLVEAAACLATLRQIVSGLETGRAGSVTVAETSAEIERLQLRIALLADHEQERRLRRFVTTNRGTDTMNPIIRVPLRAVLALALATLAAPAAAQSSFPPPPGPVTVCGTQAAPVATSYQLVFDGGAPEAVTLTAPAAAVCPGPSTHSFTIPAARFTVGTHTVKLIPANAFGSNATSTAFTATVGIAPGTFSVTAILAAALELTRRQLDPGAPLLTVVVGA